MSKYKAGEKALIIFIKNLVKGHVKTRLAQETGPDEALRIYGKLLNYTRSISMQIEATRFLFYSERVVDNDDWDNALFTKRVQKGDALGERMKNAFEDVLAHHRNTLIIGSDCPGLNAEIIQLAFTALQSHDAVIGPSLDGGYYLLGLKSLETDVFENMPWSTTKVLYKTQKRLETAGKTYLLLPVLSDIDHYDDWLQYGWPDGPGGNP